MNIQKINSDSEFKEFISKEKAAVLVHKTNCPYCEDALGWLDKNIKSNLNLAKANQKDIPKILELIQIPSFPTFIAFENGTVKEVFSGDTRLETVEAFVKRHE